MFLRWKYLNILRLNPNFNTYSADEQESALEFYSLNEAYTKLPYEKIKNFCDFTGIHDRTVAANHLFIFGEFTPEWVDVTPRNLGTKASKSFLRKIGHQGSCNWRYSKQYSSDTQICKKIRDNSNKFSTKGCRSSCLSWWRYRIFQLIKNIKTSEEN